jgi:hypothetical protein
MRHPVFRQRRLASLGVAIAVVGLLVVFLVAPAGAVHLQGLFELGPTATTTDEGGVTNILGNSTDPGPDWANIFDASGNVTNLFGGITAGFIKDDVSANSATDRTTFSGTSNKNEDPISQADCANRTPPLTGSSCKPWIWNSGNVPPKDDLTNLYSYATMPSSGPLAGHLILYAGFEREDPSGQSHVDIEYLQDQVGLANADSNGFCSPPAGASNCNFTGVRTLGDIILSMDFLNGGAFGSAVIHKWDGSAYQQVALLGGQGCVKADGTAGDDLCAFDNAGPINGGPWPNYDNHGAEITTLPANAFTEVGVDLTNILGSSLCISTFIGKTRSSGSGSFTSELKDFAGPSSFNICGAQISIAPSAVNEVGHNHTFTVHVDEKLGNSTAPAPDGTIVTVTLTPANGAVVSGVVDNCASPGTVNGVCTVTFTSNSAGTVTGHAAADVTFGGSTFHVETDGTGTNSGNALKRFVDAKISIGPDATNGVGEPHTFTVNVKQDDGLTAAQGGDGVTGFANAPNGTKPIVTLTDSGGAIHNISSNTCASPGTSGGNCSVTFTSNTAGTITGHATVTFSVGGVSLTRATDNTHGSTGDATKNFVAGSLTWLKRDNAGNLLGGATFQVCRTADRFGNPVAGECVSVTDNLAPDADPVAGQFKLTGLKLGHYTVQETAAPPGYAVDPSIKTADLTLAAPNASITIAFVDQRPIVKITAFGYTNAPTGTPTGGVVSGTTVYTIKVKNFGGTSTTLTHSSLVVSVAGAGTGTLTCTGGNTLTITGSLAVSAELTFTKTCTYANLADAAAISATLNVRYTTNTLERTASGSPALIRFTIQSD